MAGDMNSGSAQGIYLRIPDRLASTAVMTWPQNTGVPAVGSEVSRYAYSPWGKMLSQEDLLGAAFHQVGYDTTRAKFTGQDYEDYSQLMFYGARFYDPRTKRFLTPDSHVAQGGVGAVRSQ